MDTRLASATLSRSHSDNILPPLRSPMPSAQLTDRQQNVYDMIRDLIVKRGYGPTVREIGEHFGIKSPNGVMCHLRALERKGLIRRSPNKSRAIELTQSADRNGNSLPLAGMVAAGPTSLAFAKNNRVDFSEMFFKDDRFILRVSGDSMIDAHITDCLLYTSPSPRDQRGSRMPSSA